MARACSQTLALPTFTPGSLEPAESAPGLHGARRRRSRSPSRCRGFTFNRGFATTQEEMKSPMIVNWTLGYQREIWRDAALEIRYVGNRGSNLWRFYNINETNIIENNFVQEFRNAQREPGDQRGERPHGLRQQRAARPGRAADLRYGVRSARIAACASPPRPATSNATFITNLQHGEAGRLANTLAGNGANSCPVHVPAGRQRPARLRVDAGYNAPGTYPINFFQANPFAAGQSANAGC